MNSVRHNIAAVWNAIYGVLRGPVSSLNGFPWDWTLLTVLVSAIALGGAVGRHERGTSTTAGVVASRDIHAFTILTSDDVKSQADVKVDQPVSKTEDALGAVALMEISEGSELSSSEIVRAPFPVDKTWVVINIPSRDAVRPEIGSVVRIWGSAKDSMASAEDVSASAIVVQSDDDATKLLMPSDDATRASRYLVEGRQLVLGEPVR